MMMKILPKGAIKRPDGAVRSLGEAIFKKTLIEKETTGVAGFIATANLEKKADNKLTIQTTKETITILNNIKQSKNLNNLQEVLQDIKENPFLSPSQHGKILTSFLNKLSKVEEITLNKKVKNNEERLESLQKELFKKNIFLDLEYEFTSYKNDQLSLKIATLLKFGKIKEVETKT